MKDLFHFLIFPLDRTAAPVVVTKVMVEKVLDIIYILKLVNIHDYHFSWNSTVHIYYKVVVRVGTWDDWLVLQKCVF
jgi:hypothetical protein